MIPEVANRELRRAVPRRDGAFTILELSVVIVLLTVVLGIATSVVLHSAELFADQVLEHIIDEAGGLVCDRLTEELRSAYPLTLLPLSISSSTYVTYQKVIGHEAGAPKLGPVTTLRMDLVPGELLNGLDDNGDGRVDEGFLTLTEGTNAPLAIRGHLLRLGFDSTPSGMSFSVDIGVSDRKGTVRLKTFAQKVSFRTRP